MSDDGKRFIHGSRLELYRVNVSSPEFRYLFCRSYEIVIASGYSVKRENYRLIFSSCLPTYNTVDELYLYLCNAFEQGLLCHKICVSDVLVIKEDKNRAYYVDSNGFVEVTNIFKLE